MEPINLQPQALARLRRLYALAAGADLAASAAVSAAARVQREYQQYLEMVCETIGIDAKAIANLDLDTGTVALKEQVPQIPNPAAEHHPPPRAGTE